MSTFANFFNNELFTLEYFYQEDVCRLCWSRNAVNELYAGIDHCNLRGTLINKVRNCLDLDLTHDSLNYPKKLCEMCTQKVEQFNEFKVYCRDSNKKLNTILKDTIKRSSVKILCAEKLEEKRFNLTNHVFEEALDNVVDSSQFSESCLKGASKLMEISETNTKVLDCFIDSQSPEKEKIEIMKKSKKLNKISKTGTKRLIKSKSLKYLQKSNHLSENPELEDNTTSFDNHKKISKATAFIKKCTDIKNTKASLAKKKDKYKRRTNFCTICFEDFKDEHTFSNHKSEAHGIQQDGTYKCFGCEKLHKNRKSRLCHEAYFCKSLEDGYKCNICNRFLPKRGAYERHLRDHRLNKVIDAPEETSGIFKCDKCSEQFTKKSVWKKHMIEHAPKKNYVCETCGKVFSRLDYLQKHTITHTGQRPYACPHCGYRSAQQQNITIHIRKHTNERPYACDLCPQRCVSKSNLYAHRRRHLGLNPFQCSICSKKFGYKLSLKEHILFTHQKSQANNCQHCGAAYARKSGLRRHIRSKHPAEFNKNLKTLENSTNNILRTGQNISTVPYPNTNKNNDEKVSYPSEDENNQVLYPDQNIIKIDDRDKYVCFDKSFGTKDGDNIIIVLQE